METRKNEVKEIQKDINTARGPGLAPASLSACSPEFMRLSICEPPSPSVCQNPLALSPSDPRLLRLRGGEVGGAESGSLAEQLKGLPPQIQRRIVEGKEVGERKIQEIKDLHKELQSLAEDFKVLKTQANENQNVKVELDLMQDGFAVYKQAGPVLIPKTLEEAKENVDERLTFLNAELKNLQKRISDAQKAMETRKNEVKEIQKDINNIVARVQAESAGSSGAD
eukprot:CAMPEP_0184327208 /NCGR_PEP_ID=MMETSP1049-20130417/142973_1 /TAXON_ID=77928 /ORGANISM="Proteomonas sulcata, Strain CCMP704" /LENGTH=224 /DNA_ID=CAMNT_0026649453 /DNA_START=487 /DNA_END=1162 /DNA_ORIENTATION=+